MQQLLESFSSRNITYPFQLVREVKGKFKGTKFRYLFCSYDTKYLPTLFQSYSPNTKRDLYLRERKKGSIEDVVADFYTQKK